jgi:hypothetical protein
VGKVGTGGAEGVSGRVHESTIVVRALESGGRDQLNEPKEGEGRK